MSTNEDITPNITKLELSDDFYTLFLTTNKLIDYVNPIQLYDVTLGAAFTESRGSGVVNIDLNVGNGLKLFPSVGSGNLTLDLEAIYSSNEVVLHSDYILIERPSTTDSNYIFSVLAEDMLPPTLNDNHLFYGTITVNALNVNDNVVRLQYGDSTTQNDSGLILDTTSSTKVKFTYNTTKSAWFSSKNLGLQDGYSFVTNGTSKDAYFRYATTGNQYDVILEMSMGLSNTSSDDASWLIEARRLLRKLDFVYRNSVTTDLDRVIFSAQLDDDYGYNSTFYISDKINIGNVKDSINFKSVTNYSASIIPISNSYGVLDSKWTNRYVTSNYSSISVGDIVSIYDHTSGSAMVIKETLSSSSTNELDTHPIGIVEKISGGVAYIAMLGEFTLTSTPSPAFVSGLTYYLTTGSPNYTLTKPTSGMIKPLFIATGNASGIIFPMSSGLLSYGQFSVNTAGESGYIIGAGSSVYSSATNGNVTFKAGQGITLQTDNFTKEITIRALTQGNEPGYAQFYTMNDGHLLQAVTPHDTLVFTGAGGNIEITGTNTTNADSITIRGKFFSNVAITSDDTNEDTDLFHASYDDTITFYGGTGIQLSRYAPGSNAIKIVATSDIAQSVIGDYSLTLRKLSKQSKNSILYTSSTSTYEEIRALQASSAYGSFLVANTTGQISWSSPFFTMTSYVASNILNAGEVTYDKNNNRFFGISTYNSSNVIKDTAFFIQNTFGGANNRIQVSLVEGTGIQLTVVKDPTDPGWTGAPSIKITNTATGTQFNNFYIGDTGETLFAGANGRLNLLTPVGSPIVLDSDTNTQNLYFNISDNSITNRHLSAMPDNTVKIGRGTTDPSTPEDLLISSNSVLGRLSGDLQSLSRTNLLTLLQFSGSSYFNEVEGDSGYTTSLDSETLTLVGGSGITVDVDTNNRVVITNTLPDSGTDMGINLVGTRSYNGTSYFYNNALSGLTKLYFDSTTSDSDEFVQADILASFSPVAGDSLKGTISLKINWTNLGLIGTGAGNNTPAHGSGLMYGYGSEDGYFKTRFAQLETSPDESNIPYFSTIGSTGGELRYLNSSSSVYTGSLQDGCLLGFSTAGNLVKTNQYVSNVSGNIIGLQFSGSAGGPRYLSLDNSEPHVLFYNINCENGGFRTNSGLAMYLDPVEGKEIAFLTPNTQTAFTELMYINFASDADTNSGYYVFEALTDTKIAIKTFAPEWYGLAFPKICLPSSLMFGAGPTSSLLTSSSGYLVSNSSGTGAFVLTNYNLSTSGSKTFQKDRSSRLSLSVLDVDSEASHAYLTVKTTGSLTHTYSITTDIVDRFTVAVNNVKSAKYLIQAVSTSNQVFTSEFIVQVSTFGAGSCKYIQYASVSQDGGFTLDVTATLSGTTVTINHNASSTSTAMSVVKIIKQEM